MLGQRPAPITFDGLLARLGQAAIHAQRIASTSALKRWRDMCTVGDDGVLTPNMMHVRVDDKVIPIPELAMAHPSIMPLKELRVKFEAQVDLSSGTDDDGETIVPTLSVTARRGMFKRNTHFEVEAVFELAEPPESIEVLRDALANQVKDNLHA